MGLELQSEPLPPLIDWGLLYSSDYLLSRYKWYRKTNQFPNGKSMDEQRRSLLTDFRTLDYLVQWWMEKLSKQKNTDG